MKDVDKFARFYESDFGKRILEKEAEYSNGFKASRTFYNSDDNEIFASVPPSLIGP